MNRVNFRIDGVMVLTVAVGALVVYAGYKLAKNSDQIIAKVNPASPNNFIYELANWGWSPLIGENENIGGWLSDQVTDAQRVGGAIVDAALNPAGAYSGFSAWLAGLSK